MPWRVDTATWHAFLEADRHAHGGPDRLPNELSTNVDVPADGLDIIVGRDAIGIGGGSPAPQAPRIG